MATKTLKVPVPRYGDTVTDLAGNTGKAAFNPNTGESLTRYSNPAPKPSSPSSSSAPPKPVTVDESGIRDSSRRQVQGQIDAVNELAATELAAARVNATERLGQTRAMNANTGLIGSPTGDAQTEKTRGVNAAEMRAINAQTASRISGILDGVNTRADNLINNAKTASRQDAETYRGFLKEQSTQARGDFQTLASMGAELTHEQRQRLLEQTGYDPDTFDQLYKGLKIANGPTYFNKDKPEIVGNKAVFFKQNEDGTISSDTIDLPIAEGIDPKDIEVVTRKDGIYMLNKRDGTFKRVGQAEPGATDGNTLPSSAVLADYPPDIQAAAQSILDGKSKLNEYPSAKRLMINAAMSKVYTAEGGNELAQGAYDAAINLKSHAGFKSAVGTNLLFGFGKGIAGTASAGFIAELDKLKANLKLVNIKYLKGTGALSDAEGKTLEDASTSLNPSLPEGDFTKELKRVTDALTKAKGISTISSGNIQEAPDGSQVEIID